MKVIPFTIPVPADVSIHVHHDVLPHYYEHLHRHKEVQITWLAKGTGTLLAGSYLNRFSEGELYIFGAHQPHVFKSDPQFFKPKKQGRAESFSIFFDPKGKLSHLFELPEMSSLLPWLEKIQQGMMLPPPDAAPFLPLIKQVIESKRSERLAAFIQLIQQLAANKKQTQLSAEQRIVTDAEGQRINEVVQYSMKHFTETISISDVAKQIHMTPPAFCRYFKKHTRKTYIGFLNELRINEACKLLQQQGRENIASIAWQTGFTNVPNFNRVFRKVIGMAPGEYLRKTMALGQ